MLVTLLGIVTLVRLVQAWNAQSPMLVTGRPLIVSGMVTAPPERSVSRDGDRAVVGRVSVWQAAPPEDRQTSAPARGPWQVIDGRIVVIVEHIVTNAGGVALEIVTPVRLVQQRTHQLPMLVTLLGIVMLVRLVQPGNARVPDAGDRQAI